MYTILGATGNIGSKVADILLKKGEKVRVVGRSEERLAPLGARGAEIYAGNLLDTRFLTRAFTGAAAVLVLLPPNPGAEDFGEYQDAVGESIAVALRDAGVRHAINISSVGAELPGGTGPIAGLYRQEKRLNSVYGLNVLHLRNAFFMENLLMHIPLIRSSGIMGSAIRGDIPMPMIATKDIAEVAAGHLVSRDFSGSVVQELLGQRHVTLQEAASAIGRALGIPGLRYEQFPYEKAEEGLRAAGLSPDMSKQYIEMSRAFNEGRIGTELRRSRENTTPTSIEEFSKLFALRFNGVKAA